MEDFEKNANEKSASEMFEEMTTGPMPREGLPPLLSDPSIPLPANPNMVSDPEPPKPTFTVSELPEDEAIAELKAKQNISRADAYFDSHRITRVPMIALQSDTYQVPEQKFVCFSVIKPDEYRALHHKNRQYTGFLIKFRGVFKSREEADKHIRRVMKTDPHFDVHLVPCFEWAGIEDDVVEEREYADEMIGSMIKGYFENENDKFRGVRDRIRDTEQSTRSEETTQFWEEAQRERMRKEQLKLEGQTQKDAGPPMTLSQLAASMGIEPEASVKEHKSAVITKEIPVENGEMPPVLEPRVTELSETGLSETGLRAPVGETGAVAKKNNNEETDSLMGDDV